MKITQEQYDEAARAVILAVRARRATSNRRLHTDRYKKVAAKVLGITAVYPARWAQIIQAGHRLGLFGVDGTQARLHWAVRLPEDNADLYVDHDGRWKCHTCARLHFSESWGGVKQWRARR